MIPIVFKFRYVFLCFSIILTLTGTQPALAAGTCYVNDNAAGTNSGTSWENAYISLQSALADTCTEIWVAAGTYTPHASDRSVSFALKSGVTIYGGFTGTETLLSQRNVTTNITVLSGDLSANDSGFTNNGENSYHVVAANNTDTTSILDGFTIRGGNANYSNVVLFGDDNGGGMYIDNSSPILTNLIFTNNTATKSGGGMIIFLENSSPILTNVAFNNNSAETGGGIDNFGSVTLTNVSFTSNSAQYGGGMHNYSNATLTNVSFTDNSAQYGGGMRNFFGGLDASLTDVTFTSNHASMNGGGMYNVNDIAPANGPTLTNVTFTDNSAELNGGGMFNALANPSVTNGTFDQNTAMDEGGGMSNDEASPILFNVAFILNIADYGGGMSNRLESSPSLTNVTFNENVALIQGGGIYNTQDSNPIITNVTFRNNDGANGNGIFNDNSSPTLKNVIIAEPSNGCVNSSSSLNSASSNNLIKSTGSEACGLVNGSNGNIIGSDPNLGDFVNSPGYFPLNAGSPAIDTGTNTGCPSTDQRGETRPQNGVCDIGAYEFTVDTTIPTVTAFSVPSSSNSLTISITSFTASDNVAVNGYLITESSTPPLAGAAGWTASAPTTYTVSSDGNYTLYPWAKDAAGNVSALYGSPASVAVDATNPETIITGNPSNPTNSTSATFNFNGNDASGTGVAGFECKLDGGSFTTCTDPGSYTGLSEGSHTFEVRAIDNVGNVDATPASYTWMIDTTAPGVTITGNPTDPTNSTSATFTFTGDDGTGSGVSGFECKLDGGSFGTCVSGVSYTSLSAGSHTFEVRAIDTANNVGTLSDSYTWIIDLTAPTVTINQDSSQADPTSSNSINFTVVFSKPVTGFIGSDVSLSGTATPSSAVVTESAPNDGTTYNVAVSGMTSGGTVIADIPANVVQDLATNNNAASTSTDNTVTFTVDTTTTITSDLPDPSTAGQAVTVNFTVTAGLGTPNSGNVTVTDSGGATPCVGAVTAGAGSCNITLTTPGTHTLTATYATSGAFNGSSDTEAHSVSVTLAVNTFADELNTNGNCSLREAVRASNSNAAVDACPAGSATITDVITLATGTYTISRSGVDDTAISGDLDITGNTRITGAGAASTFISGASLDRVFHILSGSVEINNLTVKSGSNATGGGINNAGALTLNSVTVTANASTTGANGISHGAGIYNTGTLTLNNATVSNNTAASGASGKSRGGGIHNNGGTVTLNSSTVTGNKAMSAGLGTSQGGGIYTNGGSTTLNSTTPSGNTVVAGAGGTATGPNTYP
jgi:CSLREA domain-containing protein